LIGLTSCSLWGNSEFNLLDLRGQSFVLINAAGFISSNVGLETLSHVQHARDVTSRRAVIHC
jgi:hypothetical protein